MDLSQTTMPEPDLRRAAILVASLDIATARRVLNDLPSRTQTEIEQLILDLDAIDPAEQQAVLNDFLGQPTPEVLLTLSNPATEQENPEISSGTELRSNPALNPQTVAAWFEQASDVQLVELLGTLPPNTRRRLSKYLGISQELDSEQASDSRTTKPEAKQQSEFPLQEFICAGRMEDLEDEALVSALLQVDRYTAVLALATANKSLVDRIFAQLPFREARLMQHELDHLAAIRFADVEAAQKQIVCLANQQAESMSVTRNPE